MATALKNLWWSCLMSSLVTSVYSASAQQFAAPQHDARIVVGLPVFENGVTHFYDVYYGHNIRLGEYSCGDPQFLVHVNEVPRLRVDGLYPQNGDFSAKVSAFSGANAKVYEMCLGYDHPSVGGTAQLSATVGNLTTASSISLTGSFQTGPIMGLRGLQFPISKDIPLPAQFFNHLPVKLSDPRLDFGSLNGDTWTSVGDTRNVDVTIRAGAIGSSTNGSTFLSVDATVGNQESFQNFNTNVAARSNFESDMPIQSGENFGVGIKKSFLGSASASSGSTGFIGALLPIRISDEGTYRILFWKRKIKWQAVMTIASVGFTQNEGKDAFEIKIGSTFAKVGDSKLVGTKAINAVTGDILLDRLQLQNQVLHFRVADFKIKIKVARFIIFPIRLSSGQLEDQLNHGSLVLANVPFPIQVSLPDPQFSPPCVNTNWDKMKADYRLCNDPGQRIGYLSFERGYGGGYESIGFRIDPTYVSSPRVVGSEMKLGNKIVLVYILHP